MEQTQKKKKGGCLKAVLITVLILIVILAVGLFWLYRANKDDLNEHENRRFTETYTGQTMPDFEVTTTEGETVTLESLLQDKELAVVVLFATWCGPCEREFPEMDSVYKKYADKMSMIGIDGDSLDTEKDVKEYADSHKFKFPIAYHKGGIEGIQTTAYPTTLIIDRNGKIGMHRVGSVPDAETFERLISGFMGDDYQEAQVGYYSFIAYTGNTAIPGVECEVTSEAGTQTYTTDKDGSFDVFTDKPEDLKIKIISVPDGYRIDGDAEFNSGIGSTSIRIPVKK